MTANIPARDTPRADAGRTVLSEFLLDPRHLHLNHGSYGALPISVFEEQTRIHAQIERDPTSYFQFEYPQAVRDSAAVAAAKFGGEARDWVFCENATAAVNSVLSSLPLNENDEIVTTSHAYGAVMKAMRIWAGRRGAKLVVADVPPFVEGDDQIVAAIEGVLTPRTRLLVADHITSATAIIFPAARIVKAAHDKGVPVLIDGAHVPGHIALDVPAVGADWYTGNAHKWLFAPKACGLLWTSPDRQSMTRPVVLSHGSEESYIAAFDWIGTRDATPWLCLKAAIRAHDRYGGARLMARNSQLAAEAADFLSHRLNGRVSAPAGMRGAMAALALDTPPNQADPPTIRWRLAHEFRITVPVFAFADRLWVRISAQVYNETGDYEALAEALAKCLAGSA